MPPISSEDRIEVYNSHWRRVRWVWDGDDVVQPFGKPADIPANYVPFNIQYLDGLLYVAMPSSFNRTIRTILRTNHSPSAHAPAAVMSPCSISAAYTFGHLPGKGA